MWIVRALSMLSCTAEVHVWPPGNVPDRTQLTCIELPSLGTGIRSTPASEPFL